MRIGPESTLSELSEFIRVYKVSIRPELGSRGGFVVGSLYKGVPLELEGRGLETCIRYLILGLLSHHSEVLDLEWHDSGVHVKQSPSVSRETSEEIDARDRELRFAGCHLPLAALEPSEVCPQCECLASSHRRHPSNKGVDC